MNLDDQVQCWHTDAKLPETVRKRLIQTPPQRSQSPARLPVRSLVAGGAVAFLSLLSAAWYKSHYHLPPVTTTWEREPIPNGYKTAVAASRDLVEAVAGATLPTPYRPTKLKPTLTARQELLAANQKAIQQLRRAFDHEWQAPHSLTQPELPRLRKLGWMLTELAEPTYAESGNTTQALRCDLDAIALGVRMVRGGGLLTSLYGAQLEHDGEQGLWELLAQLDLARARATLRSLLALEGQRTPYKAVLEAEQKRFHQSINTYFSDVIRAWQAIDPLEGIRGWRYTQRETIPQRTWARLRVVFHGPQSAHRGIDMLFAGVIQQSQQPWQPNLQVAIPDEPYCMFVGNTLTLHDLRWSQGRASRQLLITSLALRLYRLEKGSTAPSLEALVAAGYLPTLPEDPFSPTRAPLRYQEGRLWSVGPDGIDNGGLSVQTRDQRKVLYARGQKGDMLPPEP